MSVYGNPFNIIFLKKKQGEEDYFKIIKFNTTKPRRSLIDKTSNNTNQLQLANVAYRLLSVLSRTINYQTRDRYAKTEAKDRGGRRLRAYTGEKN